MTGPEEIGQFTVLSSREFVNHYWNGLCRAGHDEFDWVLVQDKAGMDIGALVFNETKQSMHASKERAHHETCIIG